MTARLPLNSSSSAATTSSLAAKKAVLRRLEPAHSASSSARLARPARRHSSMSRLKAPAVGAQSVLVASRSASATSRSLAALASPWAASSPAKWVRRALSKPLRAALKRCPQRGLGLAVEPGGRRAGAPSTRRAAHAYGRRSSSTGSCSRAGRRSPRPRRRSPRARPWPRRGPRRDAAARRCACSRCPTGSRPAWPPSASRSPTTRGVLDLRRSVLSPSATSLDGTSAARAAARAARPRRTARRTCGRSRSAPRRRSRRGRNPPRAHPRECARRPCRARPPARRPRRPSGRSREPAAATGATGCGAVRARAAGVGMALGLGTAIRAGEGGAVLHRRDATGCRALGSVLGHGRGGLGRLSAAPGRAGDGPRRPRRLPRRRVPSWRLLGGAVAAGDGRRPRSAAGSAASAVVRTGAAPRLSARLEPPPRPTSAAGASVVSTGVSSVRRARPSGSPAASGSC